MRDKGTIEWMQLVVHGFMIQQESKAWAVVRIKMRCRVDLSMIMHQGSQLRLYISEVKGE